jgi:Domain of unknown function (DUF4214)
MTTFLQIEAEAALLPQARADFNAAVNQFNRDINLGAAPSVTDNDGLALGLAGYAYGEATGAAQIVGLGLAANPEFVGNSDLAQVARIYVAAFDRAPDAAGLQFWTDQMQAGMTQEQVASNFLGTPEGLATLGSATIPGFVNDLYQHVLGRGADAAGARFWTSAIEGGQITVGGALAAFANSPEFTRA